MYKNKNGNAKSQIHLYSNPKLYGDFKETIKEVNTNTGNDFGISEILRACMHEFCRSADFQQLVISNIGGGVDE